MAETNPIQQHIEALDDKIQIKHRLEVFEEQVRQLLSIDEASNLTENSGTPQQEQDELHRLRAELNKEKKHGLELEMRLMKCEEKMKKEYNTLVDIFKPIKFNRKDILISLSETDNIFGVKFLLDIGTITELKRADNKTALHIAAEAGHMGLVKLLLDNSAFLNAIDFERNTPLHLAAMNGNVEVCRLLVKNKARVNLENDFGQTPLHLSAMKGHLDICGILIAAGSNVNTQKITILNPQCNDPSQQVRVRDCTPLHLATYGGHASVVKLLVESNADTWLKNYVGKSALEEAVNRGMEEVVDYLKGYPIETPN